MSKLGAVEGGVQCDQTCIRSGPEQRGPQCDQTSIGSKSKLEATPVSKRSGGGVKHRREPTTAVCRRNERERNRVKQVNLNFERLRRHVPAASRNKKLSKMDTLRSAVNYIQYLKDLLESTDSLLARPLLPLPADPDPLTTPHLLDIKESTSSCVPILDLDPSASTRLLDLDLNTSSRLLDTDTMAESATSMLTTSCSLSADLSSCQQLNTAVEPANAVFDALLFADNSFGVYAESAESEFKENSYSHMALKENLFTDNIVADNIIDDKGAKRSSVFQELVSLPPSFASTNETLSGSYQGNWGMHVAPAPRADDWGPMEQPDYLGLDGYPETEEKVRDCLLRELTAWLMQ